MKKTVFFSPLHPTGGIASCTKNVLEYVKAHDINNFIFVDASIRFKSAKRASKLNRIASGIFDTLLLIFKFTIALIKHHPETVHINTSASLALNKDLIYLRIASFFKCKVVFHYHFGRIPYLAKNKDWEWEKLCKCIGKAKYAIVIDPESYKTLCDNGFKEKTGYIPNPCSPKLEKIANLPIRAKRQNSMIYVGHIVPTKGVFELIEALSQIPEDISLIMIRLCDERIKEQLTVIAKAKNDGNWLTIAGNQSRDYVFDKMATADALVLPSYTEGFPNVVLEAMACGCPVIGTTVGAIPDMLSIDNPEKTCGICCKPQSTDDLKNAISKFINCGGHKAIFASNGKKKVLDAYTMEKVFPLYERVWNRS